ARQAPEQSALPGDLAPLRTWQHHLDQQQRLQCLGRGLRRRPGDRKRHPRPPAPPLPRHQHPRRELPPQGEKAGRPLLPLAPAPGERRPSTRMNTGGGSVFHRQRWVIFRATLTAFGYLAPYSSAKSAIPFSAVFRLSAFMISRSASLALGWSRFGSLSSTLARRCTQQRCSRVSGHTSRTAAQNPSAPSPTASTGALMPRRLGSLSSAAQLSVLSR